MYVRDSHELDEPEALNQHYDVLKELGDCYAATEQPDMARQCYREASALAPHMPGPYIGMGVLALQQDQLQQAMQAFTLASRLDGRCGEAYGGLAMTLQQMNDLSGAFDMYLKCLDIDGDNLVALLGLFQTSCQMGTFSKIIHYLEIYLERHPGDTSVLFCLATLYARDGRLDEAQQQLTTVLALEPGNPDAVNLLAEVRHKLASTPLLNAK